MDSEIANGFAVAGRFGLAAIFFSSGFGKLRHPSEFRDAVDSYDVGPAALRRLTMHTLPAIEVGLAIFWLSDQLPAVAAIVTIGLLSGFTTAMAINLRRGRAIPCGCSGLLRSGTVSWGAVIRNCGLSLMVLLALVAGQRSPWIVGTKSLQEDVHLLLNADAALLVFTATVLLLLEVLAVGELVDLRPKVRKTRYLFRSMATDDDEVAARAAGTLSARTMEVIA